MSANRHAGHHCFWYCGGTCRQQYGVCRYGALASKNAAENNMLNVIATETAAIAGATGNASKDTGNDNSWDTAGGCEGSREQCAVRDPSRDGTRGPGHVLNGDNTDEDKQPNQGKELAGATDNEKAELGSAGAGTPGDGDQIMKKKPVIRRFSNNDLMN